MWVPQMSLKLLFSDWLLPTRMHKHTHTRSICTLLALKCVHERESKREGESRGDIKGRDRNNVRAKREPQWSKSRNRSDFHRPAGVTG